MSLRKRILVVDDEPKIRRLLREVLELREYEVMTAADGPEALEQLKGQPVDLILLDVVMPKMDGWEVLKRLRRHHKTRSIPTIMLTAKGETGDLLRSEDLRATDHFIKPFEVEELLAFIRRYI